MTQGKGTTARAKTPTQNPRQPLLLLAFVSCPFAPFTRTWLAARPWLTRRAAGAPCAQAAGHCRRSSAQGAAGARPAGRWGGEGVAHTLWLQGTAIEGVHKVRLVRGLQGRRGVGGAHTPKLAGHHQNTEQGGVQPPLWRTGREARGSTGPHHLPRELLFISDRPPQAVRELPTSASQASTRRDAEGAFPSYV